MDKQEKCCKCGCSEKMHNSIMCEKIQQLQTDLAKAMDGNERLKATNQRLNRRTQEAESALVEWQKISEVTKSQSTGRFFPALVRYALTKAEAENERLKKVLFFITNDVFPEIITKANSVLKEQ